MPSSAGNDVVRYLILLLIAGNLFALAVGVMMLLAPARLNAWFNVTDRLISMRRLTKPLDVMRDTDTTLFRYSRVLGAAMLAGAVFILIKGGLFFSHLDVVEGGRLLARFFAAGGPNPAWEALWLALGVFIMFGALLALVVGGLMLFRLETLRRWSEAANRWFSTRRAFKPLAVTNLGLVQHVRAKPQLWGGIIAAAALYSLVMLVWFARAVF